ncbi:diadenylate cyclase CdaA [Cardinium endosymbiont of Culicoides punctatus]|uniref:diadenylate cyclase CdaA n=1 Tax=Cardinium endosymbiont of Culicoides punctatus TaxID=2304601 RepID=UPI00105841B3|nr:diadenylate cyclase CdaA [Cardinium endosymbiont of Culicoides punctatus]TDG95688.1 Cyclic di-AMP synthase CdaA [Cardinium endosymbiont of Culicoides punctatus]
MPFNLPRFDAIDISFVRVIDMVLVGFLVYRMYKLIEGSITVKISFGFFVVYLLYLLVKLLKLELLGAILGKFIELGPVLPVILFQREIRHFLSSMGKGLISTREVISNITPWFKNKKIEFDVTPVVKAVQALGGSNTGALIVFTKDADLRNYEESGDLINAVVSSRLLLAIFSKYSPLHDGAVIIHDNKIVAARCILPVTENISIAANFGLRHKAAIGITEVTDTLVLIVSEESGQISIARNGKMENNLSAQEVRSAIKDYLSTT